MQLAAFNQRRASLPFLLNLPFDSEVQHPLGAEYTTIQNLLCQICCESGSLRMSLWFLRARKHCRHWQVNVPRVAESHDTVARGLANSGLGLR